MTIPNWPSSLLPDTQTIHSPIHTCLNLYTYFTYTFTILQTLSCLLLTKDQVLNSLLGFCTSYGRDRVKAWGRLFLKGIEPILKGSHNDMNPPGSVDVHWVILRERVLPCHCPLTCLITFIKLILDGKKAQLFHSCLCLPPVKSWWNGKSSWSFPS